MKERPILFSGAMVRALLDGSKTQTRRIVKGVVAVHSVTGEALGDLDSTGPRVKCLFGEPGDRLYVRETFLYVGPGSGSDLPSYREERAYPENHNSSNCWYRATQPDKRLLWTPSIHMPRWASRITLEVTGVRVERLQDISETDAVAEGIRQHDQRNGWVNECTLADGKRHFDASAYGMFQQLWADINGTESWDANPWVWVIEFKRVTP